MPDKRPEATQAYLVAIRRALARGDSTEHTHRPALIDLVHALVKGVHCVNETKGQKHGHPDIKVTLGETPIGYIETKDVGLDLAEIVESAQLRRYLREIPNLLLTDYLTFIWFENGHERTRANLAVLAGKDKLRAVEGQDAALADLLVEFCRAELKTIASPKELAQRMASLARMTRRLIAEALAAEPATGDLHAQLKAFREVLLPDIDETKFADMYAQTICHGLFAGICNSKFPQTFARENAADNLPPTNPFLRQLFHHIVGPELNEKVRSAVDQIVFLLRHADVQAILQDFGKRTRKEDPVVHFYETFLAEYDPKLRKSRGVYYTPEPVVSYIVRSVDWLLKEKFNKPEGLADPSVLVLDPACGTGTFLYAVIKLIHERISAKGQYGAWSGYVRDNLLPRIFGFELLMAPYAVAHLKLGLLLQETGYDFGSDERLGIFLTNTLEQTAKQVEFEFARWITKESKESARIKNNETIMVVVGNPPYSKSSLNRSVWIENLMETYKTTVRAAETQIQALSDDYAKFIRFAQWRIDKTGYGVVALVSNNGYLDGPIFRDMRSSLLDTFDCVHILNLHGDARKVTEEATGGDDENVFDIQQGVGITVAVKSKCAETRSVVYADLMGSRESKYAALASSSVADTEWRTLSPEPPAALLIPFATETKGEYDAMAHLYGIFGTGDPDADNHVRYGAGFVTQQDEFAVAHVPKELDARIAAFLDPGASEDDLRKRFSLCSTNQWNYTRARDELRGLPIVSMARRFLYRPFDHRYTVFDRNICTIVRERITSQFDRPNVALLTTRRVTRLPYNNVFVANTYAEYKVASHDRNTIVFPLYVYQVSGPDELFDSNGESSRSGRRPNLSPKFVAEMEAKLGLEFVPEGAAGSLECGSKAAALSPSRPAGKAGVGPGPLSDSSLPQSKGVFTPEDVFDYIYAIFHSPTYRKRYAEFLKMDFPRVPLTSDKKLFWKLVALGRELVALHLLESPKVTDFVTKYPKRGSDTVEKVTYLDPRVIPTEGAKRRSGGISSEAGETPPRRRGDRKEAGGDTSEGRVYINDDQYFEGVKPDWFEFHIGGYQVLQKWLKDRKGRKLSNDDITHYQRVVVTIKETIRLMSEIDKAIPKWPVR